MRIGLVDFTTSGWRQVLDPTEHKGYPLNVGDEH
jgi:hypothetical protein